MNANLTDWIDGIANRGEEWPMTVPTSSDAVKISAGTVSTGADEVEDPQEVVPQADGEELLEGEDEKEREDEAER